MSGTLYTVDICTHSQVKMNTFIQVHKILRMSGVKYSNSVPLLGTYQVYSTFIFKMSGVKSLFCENVRCTVSLLGKCQVYSISVGKISGVQYLYVENVRCTESLLGKCQAYDTFVLKISAVH